MKIKLIIAIILTALTLIGKAQDNIQSKTVFGNDKLHVGYYLSPSLQVGNFAGSTAVLPGVAAGVILNNSMSLELKYKFTISENTPAGVEDQFYLHGQWIGFRGEYSIKPEKQVHVSFPLEVGIGEIELDIKDAYENQSITIPTGDALFANIEPGVAIEVNLWKYLKINFSGGYRFVSNIAFRNVAGKDLMGFTFSAGFKIGVF